MKISRWYSFSVTKSLYCAFQLNCYTVWQQEGVRERWTKKKRTHQFQTVRNRNNFFSTHCRKHSVGVYLDTNQWTAWTISGHTLPQHSADSFKCLMMPLSDLETSSSFEKASSVSVSFSVPPRFWLHKTIVREQSTGFFNGSCSHGSWPFTSSHQACRHMLSHPLSQPTAVMYIGDGPVLHYFCEGKHLFCFWEREGGWSDSVSGWHHRFSTVRWLVRVWRGFEGKEWQLSGLPGSSRYHTIHQVFALRRFFYAALAVCLFVLLFFFFFSCVWYLDEFSFPCIICAKSWCLLLDWRKVFWVVSLVFGWW